jgi:AraC-like DNA-binding protein
MPASGSSIFTDAEGYQSSLLDLFDLVVPEPRAFHARLTWLSLPSLLMLRAQEKAARVAVVRPPANQVLVVFPTRLDSLLVVDGIELCFGAAMVHALNEISYQRTKGACEWGSISLTPASLRAYGRAIAGRELMPPTTGQPLRLVSKSRQMLLRLHRQAAHLAETHLPRVIHPEVARGLDQELVGALVSAIAGARMLTEQRVTRCDASLVQRYGVMLDAHPQGLLRIKDVCSTLAISQRRLRAACAEVLGMPPDRYQRLRRLKRVRTELMRAGAASVDGRELLTRYGFTTIYRFVSEYWSTYGEMPALPARTRAW